MPVPIRIHAPEGSEKHRRSRYTIGGPDGVYAGAGYGVDQVQAPILTLPSTGIRLCFSDYHTTGRLFFDRPGNGYGVPMPKNAREMLIGDDRRFEA